MELRVLTYFLTLTEKGSISAAAKALNISQPTLSRQLIDLENELGCILFERNKEGIRLTDDGMLLRRRAGEITSLVHETTSELQLSHDTVAGTVSIGCAETRAMDLVAKLITSIHKKYPKTTFTIVSDVAENVAEQINRGTFDFGLMLRKPHIEGFKYLELPYQERSIAIMKTDCPLAEKDTLCVQDLIEYPLVLPASYKKSGILEPHKAQSDGGDLNIVATSNLAYNAIRLVEAGLGVGVTIEGLKDLTHTDQETQLAYRVIRDIPPISTYLAWKPFQFRSNASKIFLEEAKKAFV